MTPEQLAALFAANPDLGIMPDHTAQRDGIESPVIGANLPHHDTRRDKSHRDTQNNIDEILAPKNERDIQAAIFANLPVYDYPLLALLFAIPNFWRKGERPSPGMKAGVPDLFLPVARYPHHGLFIELKMPGEAKKYQPRDSQVQWHKDLRAQGYGVEVCRGVNEAIGLLCGYLRGEYAPF